jgi:hypothetical protein
MWRMKTVRFLAKQTESEMEEKGKDFQKNMMLVQRVSCKTTGIH